MADPLELLRAWQDAIRQLSTAATAPLAGQSELTRQLLAPLTRQGELLEQSLQRQTAFEQEVAGRMFAPVDTLLGVLDDTAAAMHTQALTFDAAAEALKRAAEALELQAGLLEKASRSVREPAEAMRATAGQLGGTLWPRRAASPPGGANPPR